MAPEQASGDAIVELDEVLPSLVSRFLHATHERKALTIGVPGAGSHPAPIHAVETADDHQQPGSLVKGLLNPDPMHRLLRRMIRHQRQRFGEPEQRAGVIARIHQADTVGDIQPDESLTIFLSEFRLVLRELGFCCGQRLVLARQAAGFAGLDLLIEERPARQQGKPGHRRARPGHELEPALDRTHPGHGLAGLQQRQVGVHFGGGFVALFYVRRAGAENHLVELGERGAVGQFADAGGQLGKLLAIATGADLVKHLAQAEQVGLHRARTFRRQVAFGAHERHGGLRQRDEADVGQLRNAVHKDNVRGFDVAMDEAVAVEVFERRGQGEAEADALVHRQTTVQKEFAAEIARGITRLVNGRTPAHVVGQLHDVIEAVRAAAYLEDVELALVTARNRLEALHPGELTLERAVVIERTPLNDFHGAINAEDIPGEPDLTVAALADAADERVIGYGNGRNVACARTGGRRGSAPRGLDCGQWLGFGHRG